MIGSQIPKEFQEEISELSSAISSKCDGHSVYVTFMACLTIIVLSLERAPEGNPGDKQALKDLAKVVIDHGQTLDGLVEWTENQNAN